jgi:hypothetical protein
MSPPATEQKHHPETVLLEAKRLLVHTELTSTAIAGRIAMPDPATFGKFFRR